MKNKINKILGLIKHSNFNDAKNICDEIKGDLEQDYQFINIHGYVLFRIKNYEEAIKLWEKAIKINPNYIFALNNLGNAFSKINKLEKAIKYFNQALKIKQDYFEASYGISDVYFKMKNYDDALIFLNKCIKNRPNFLPPIESKLNIFKLLNKKIDALKFLDEMISYNPNEAFYYNEKALILSQLGRELESVNSYKSAYLIDPDYPFILGNIVFNKLINCEWNQIENEFEEILSKIKEGKKVSDPLTVSYIFDSPLIQSKSAQIFVDNKKNLDDKKYNFPELKKKKK